MSSSKTHQISVHLSADQVSQLICLQGEKCVIESSARVALLFAYPNPQQWTVQCVGVACFVKDFKHKAYYIRIFDIHNSKLLWEQRLLKGLAYDVPTEYFHSFAAEKFFVGLFFTKDTEAHQFQHQVKLRWREMLQKKSHNYEMGQEAFLQLKAFIQSQSQLLETAKYTSCDKMNEKSQNAQKRRRRKLTKNDIGLPTMFQHIQHLTSTSAGRILIPNRQQIGLEALNIIDKMLQMGMSVEEDRNWNQIQQQSRGSCSSTFSTDLSSQEERNSSALKRKPPTPSREWLSSIVNESSENCIAQQPKIKPEDVRELQQKLNEAEDKTICPVCLDNSFGVVFQCGHVVCHDCNAKVNNCPICRSKIANRIIVYL